MSLWQSLRRAVRLHADDPPLTRDQEEALRTLKHLVTAYDGAVDPQLLREFEQFERDVERYRQGRRDR